LTPEKKEVFLIILRFFPLGAQESSLSILLFLTASERVLNLLGVFLLLGSLKRDGWYRLIMKENDDDLRDI
jgi:hypothetical protein